MTLLQSYEIFKKSKYFVHIQNVCTVFLLEGEHFSVVVGGVSRSFGGPYAPRTAGVCLCVCALRAGVLGVMYSPLYHKCGTDC